MLIKKLIITLLVFGLTFNIIADIKISKNVSGKLLFVGGNGEGNYTYIQNAINASSFGDIIFVYIGIYPENLEIYKSISLIGENKESTIINGRNASSVIKLNASFINITGFTIENGNASGILIEKCEKCYINKNIIDHNLIGINIISSQNIMVFNNTISNNSDTGLNIKNLDILSEKNIIYHNNFFNNKNNVFDEGENNWSFENEGNFYDDYDRLDKNNDGIGDISYKIYGGENIDYYPLMMPYIGKIRLKEYYVDDESLYTMLIIGMIIAILFLLPIAFIWYKKTKHLK